VSGLSEIRAITGQARLSSHEPPALIRPSQTNPGQGCPAQLSFASAGVLGWRRGNLPIWSRMSPEVILASLTYR
jgi:hypothetical protein